jgi:hypothetical protein
MKVSVEFVEAQIIADSVFGFTGAAMDITVRLLRVSSSIQTFD